MNLNRKKKGFTIVELVIVIAVIGVLAAILIPTFVGLVNKANVAADGTLVRELNNAIALDLAEKGETKHATMTDALDATKEYGFDVSRISTKASKNKILWDSVHGVFCYLQEDAAKVEYVPGSVKEGDELSAGDYRLWIISSTVDGTYSTYLYKATETTFTTTKGLDVGNEDVTSVTYERTGTAQEVVIRTNNYNTVLTVNAPNDVVKHYGKANKVDVIAVAGSSYHENGDVLGNITLNNGRVVVEEGAKANAVYVDATAEAITAGTVTVSADNSKEPEVPIILRDYVKEAADNKGGNNSIPNPVTHNVIVLSDKVTSDETKTAIAVVIKSDKTTINYETFQEALDAMIPDSTVMLLADIENSPILRLDKSVAGNYKIDLNGHSITFTTEGVASDEMAFEIEGAGSYVICNGTLNCYSSAYGDVLETYCNTTLNNITINFEDTSGARWGAIYNGASEMVMNSCYINAISGPGIQNGEENAKLIINDSTIISADHSALYCGGASITEVNNSVVSGVRAIHACTSGATFIINSGTFTGTDKVIKLDNTLNSVDWQGEPNYVGGSFALVYGGTFNGNILVSNNGVAKLYVYGGDYTADVSSYRV